uniref:Uncharacterized protein n=1 Tax=Oryza meridionalis TaxID=40149 RepID=A0A0E0EB84_9ORYZ
MPPRPSHRCAAAPVGHRAYRAAMPQPPSAAVPVTPPRPCARRADGRRLRPAPVVPPRPPAASLRLHARQREEEEE